MIKVTVLNRIRSFVVTVYVFFRPGKPVSRKVIASLLTSTVIYVVTLVAAKHGTDLTVMQADIVSVVAGNVAGFVAGWLRKEFPAVVSDGQDLPPSSLSAPAASVATASPVNVAADNGAAVSEAHASAVVGPPPPAS